MRCVVPVLGYEALNVNSLLRERLFSYIKRLGAEALPIDAGSIWIVEESDPTRFKVVFNVIIEDTLSEQLKEDWLQIIRVKYDNIANVTGTAELLPTILRRDAASLATFGTVNLPESITAAFAYIYKNLSKPLDISLICKDLGISKSKIEALFAQSIGKGLKHCVREVRLCEAERLLRDTALPIYEIALAVGYSELPSFDRAFRQRSKVSPSLWRQNVKSSFRIDKSTVRNEKDVL